MENTPSYTSSMNPIRSLIQRCPRRSAVYDSLSPILFDVSLRDGIQNASPEKYTTEYKKMIFHRIMEEETPRAIEIGSIVSNKVLPIMRDSLELYKYVSQYLESADRYTRTDVYLLIPSYSRLSQAIEHGVTNFSFITSVSEAFQIKNTRKSLEETKAELTLINEKLSSIFVDYRKKLYVSCMNRCPLTGPIDNDFIVKELLHYHTSYDFNEICLSDTCGTLTFEDFEYVADTVMFFGLPASKISLHLHVNESNQTEVHQILQYCFSKKIRRFDVSMLTSGGCSVTMNESQCLPNMTYDLFYSELMKKINRSITESS